MKGKKRKIKRRKSGVRLYFNEETQESIQLYQLSECEDEKKRLYVEKVYPAFDKLAENLIFVYGFITPQDDYLCLKSDCTTFLYETINKWDSSRGTKAFSYFNVVAKNWLIMNSRKSKKQSSRTVSLSDISNLSVADKRCLANYDFIPAPDDILIRRNLHNEILELLYCIKKRVNGHKEKICIDAIIAVFKNVEDLDFFE